MGKATSTTVDTEQKQEEQEEEATKHKRVAGNQERLVAHNAQSIHHPPRLPTRRCSGRAPCPGSTCFRCCDDRRGWLGALATETERFETRRAARRERGSREDGRSSSV